MELLKLLSANEIVAQIASFLILLFLLRIFAWKKILQILDERKERIASGLKQIEDSKSEIARIKSDYEARMSEIEETANRKIQEAIAAGRQITEEVRKKACAEAEVIIDNAKQNVQSELFKAKEALKEEIVNITIKAASNIIEEKLTEEQDRKMVEDFIERIEKA